MSVPLETIKPTADFFNNIVVLKGYGHLVPR